VVPATPLDAVVPALEERVRRLEEALARLQQPGRHAPPPAEQIRKDPAAAASTAAVLVEVGKRLLQPSESRPAAAAAPTAPTTPPLTRRWLVTELVAEARAIVRMYVDPRYRLSWFGRTVPLALTAAIATSHWWVLGSSIPLFGPVLDKAIDLVLAFVLFKVLSHEARRYRQTSPDLPPALRL
jgi:hypothetical protein